MEEKNIDKTEDFEPIHNSKPPSKKKRKIAILGLVGIIVIVIGVLGFSFLTPQTVEGDWELAVNPEITENTTDEGENSQKAYYTFGKAGKYGDGVYKTFFDGGVEEGDYKLSEKDGKKLINLGTEDLEFKITGSKLLGNAKLTIIYPEYTDEETGEKHSAQEYIFVQAKAPEYEKQVYDDFQTDENLIGKWETKERTLAYSVYELSYVETVEFLDDGIMVIHYQSDDLALDRYMYYSYTAKDAELTFSLVTDKETKYTVAYEFDDEKNLRFADDSTNASIFADEFFSDVTYYRSDGSADTKPTETEVSTEK